MQKINTVNAGKVMSVYSGINGRCCCGCSGKHTYALKYRKDASKHRGYKVEDDEISDRTVKLFVNKINRILSNPKNLVKGKHEYMSVAPLKQKNGFNNFTSVVINTRLYIAYLAT